MRGLGNWAGSMKVARMDAQFDLYVERPRFIRLKNGTALPHFYCTARLADKGVAQSVSANLGETILAGFLAQRFRLGSNCLIHLKTRLQRTPDFLALIGPHLAWLFPSTSPPAWWPIEVKTRVGVKVGGWRKDAERQLKSFWGNGCDPTTPQDARAGYGIAVLVRRARTQCRMEIWIYGT